MTADPDENKQSSKQLRRRNSRPHQWLAYGLLALGFVAIVAAVLLFWQGSARAPQVPADGQSAEPTPSSAQPTAQAIAAYSVAPDHPKYIAIDSIKLPQTRIFPLGLRADQQIAVPDNIHDAGWYINSAKPGQSGAMFIYGHVSSWEARGAFYNLKKLQAGDQVVVTNGADQHFTYQVLSTKTYPHDAVPMDTVLAPAEAGKPGLNLMTCAGSVIKGTSEFDQRLVVYTKQVQPAS